MTTPFAPLLLACGTFATHTHTRYVMSASGYEIRHALLSQAKDMLYEQWHMAMDVERKKAEIENRMHS